MSIRWRLSLVVTATSAVLMILGGYLFVLALTHSLLGSIDTNLDHRAEFVALGLSRSHRFDNSPFPFQRQSTPVDKRQLLPEQRSPLQLITPSSKVIYLSGENSQVLSKAEEREARRGAIYLNKTLPGASSTYRVLAAPIKGMPNWVVVVGEPLTTTEEAIAKVRDALVAVGIVVVLFAGSGAWLLSGAALAPVERMRRQAASISENDTEARLSIPTTKDELAALGKTFDELLLRLQSALEHQRSFVADAGHELRTPVAILRAELELASRPGRSKDELVMAIERASEETERIARLAEDLLILATTDDKGINLHQQQVRLDELLRDTATANKARADKHHLHIFAHAPEGLTVQADRLRLRQCLDNLIDNALRVAPPGSTVRIEAVDLDNGEIVIEVSDEGAGFPPEFLPHAFERFRKADPSRNRPSGGAGLGLAIVAAIAAAHGGRAEASNLPGKGAKVSIYLPTTISETTASS